MAVNLVGEKQSIQHLKQNADIQLNASRIISPRFTTSGRTAVHYAKGELCISSPV